MGLERQGLGARAGLTLLGVPGDGSERTSLLGVEGDSPGLWGCWANFGFGARGGFCMPEERKTKYTHLKFKSETHQKDYRSNLAQ